MESLCAQRNGVTFIVVQKPTPGKTFNASINIKVGSAYESIELSGISHYLEHAVFLGTKNNPKRELVENHLLSFGGDYNAFTDMTSTGYLLDGPLDKLETAIASLSDLALQPTLDNEQELKKEKRVVKAELEQDLTEDGEWEDQEQVAYEILFPGHPLSRPIGGTRKSLKNIGVSDLKQYHAAHYRDASRVCFTVVSPEAPERTLEKIAPQVLPLEDKAAPQATFALPKLAPILDVAPIKTSSLMCELDMFYHFEREITSKEKTVLDLMSLVLFHSEASYIFGAARKKGLIYGTDGRFSDALGANVYRVATKVSTEKLNSFFLLYLRQVKKIIKDGIDPEFFQMCKNYQAYHLQLALENASSYTFKLLNKMFHKEQVNLPEESIANLAEISQDEVIEVLKIICVAPRKVLTIKGPEASSMKEDIMELAYRL